MKLRTLYLLTTILLFSCQNESQKITYPTTEKIPVVDTYFDTEIVDNYRWLEDDNAQETKEWVKEQNNTTFSFLEKIPFREELKDRLEQLWDYEKVSAPFKEGNYTYFYKNNGLQNQYLLSYLWNIFLAALVLILYQIFLLGSVFYLNQLSTRLLLNFL